MDESIKLKKNPNDIEPTVYTRFSEIPKIAPKFYYLASPYGYPMAVVDERMARYEFIDANLSREGHLTMSPLDKHYKLKHGLPGNYRYWQAYCEAMLPLCAGLLVICSAGWETSYGVLEEIRIAKEINIPVYYISPSLT